MTGPVLDLRELVTRMQARGVTFALGKGGRVRVRPADKVRPHERAILLARREELADLLAESLTVNETSPEEPAAPLPQVGARPTPPAATDGAVPTGKAPSVPDAPGPAPAPRSQPTRRRLLWPYGEADAPRRPEAPPTAEDFAAGRAYSARRPDGQWELRWSDVRARQEMLAGLGARAHDSGPARPVPRESDEPHRPARGEAWGLRPRSRFQSGRG